MTGSVTEISPLIAPTLSASANCRNDDDEDHTDENEGETENTIVYVRCSYYSEGNATPNLVIIIVFLAVLIDVMLMTVVDPILPDIMRDLNSHTGQLVSTQFLSRPEPLVNVSADSVSNQNNSMKIGLLVSLKPGLEMFMNVGIGALVDRIGHRVPMLLGCGFNVLATLGFAYARNFWLLVFARALQAAGSSLSVVGGLAFLATSFPDNKQRSAATGKAFAGVSFGVAGGFALGSILYQFCGRESPFIILALLNLIDAVLRWMIISPRMISTERTANNTASVCSILCDTYIIVGLAEQRLVRFFFIVISLIQHTSLGIFLGTGPAWMLYTLRAQQWNVGTILALASIVHVVVQYLTGKFAVQFGQWKFALAGVIIIAAGMSSYPACQSVWEVLGPEAVVRAGHGMLMAVINPVLCHIADIRYNSHYGIISGLYTATYDLGLCVGPNIGGVLIKHISMTWLYESAAVCLLLTSLCTLHWRSIINLANRDNEQDPVEAAERRNAEIA